MIIGSFLLSKDSELMAKGVPKHRILRSKIAMLILDADECRVPVASEHLLAAMKALNKVTNVRNKRSASKDSELNRRGSVAGAAAETNAGRKQ